jgi:hypothetical protein
VTVPAPVRIVGWILGDLATALLGTRLLEEGVGNIFRAHSRIGLVGELALLGASMALFLGYAAYTLRSHESAKWIWIAGVLWTGWGAFAFWRSSSVLRAWGASHSVFWEISGKGCESIEGCQTFLAHTYPSIEVVCYSLGAIFAFKLRGYLPEWLRRLDVRLTNPREEGGPRSRREFR